MRKSWQKYLFLFTVTFFALGFVNVLFGLLGLACLSLPFIFLAKDRKKTWCQGICPRANLFSRLFKGRSLTGRPGPWWILNGKGKWFVLGYFAINIFIIVMSTTMVHKGRMEPMEMVRFLLVFPIPWPLPQLLEVGPVADWIIHLSYRMYSMMFTTTVIGLILAWLYTPRTWCRVCPVNTISDLALESQKNASCDVPQNV